MTVGSLFSGIGGFDLAASRVWGGECVRWQVEIEPFCRQILAKHWPEVRRYRDIRELRGDELEPVDLVCGGFPCQPWSINGKQYGADDPRHLWPEMARLVQKLEPRWVVGENVPGILKAGLDPVCADLEALGYEVWTLGIPAAAVDAPHLRERFWIVAYSDSWGHAPRSKQRGEDGAELRLVAHSGGDVGNPQCEGLALGVRAQGERSHAATPGASRWTVEPGVGRVADGIPKRVDRVAALGNAVVPQVAELLFRWIEAANV